MRALSNAIFTLIKNKQAVARNGGTELIRKVVSSHHKNWQVVDSRELPKNNDVCSFAVDRVQCFKNNPGTCIYEYSLAIYLNAVSVSYDKTKLGLSSGELKCLVGKRMQKFPTNVLVHKLGRVVFKSLEFQEKLLEDVSVEKRRRKVSKFMAFKVKTVIS